MTSKELTKDSLGRSYDSKKQKHQLKQLELLITSLLSFNPFAKENNIVAFKCLSYFMCTQFVEDKDGKTNRFL